MTTDDDEFLKKLSDDVLYEKPLTPTKFEKLMRPVLEKADAYLSQRVRVR